MYVEKREVVILLIFTFPGQEVVQKILWKRWKKVTVFSHCMTDWKCETCYMVGLILVVKNSWFWGCAHKNLPVDYPPLLGMPSSLFVLKATCCGSMNNLEDVVLLAELV